MKPIISLGNHFLPTELSGGYVDWQAFGIAVSYIVVGFVVFEATTIGIKKLRERRSKES